MNFNTPNNTPTWTDAHISRNFSLKLIAHVVGRWLIKCQTLIPIFSFKNVLTDNLLITDLRYKSTTVKDRGLRLFPMALRQKLWQQKENWPSGKMEHGNECKCQLFFDLYYAKILTVFPNGLGTSLQFHKLIPSSMNDPLQKETRSLLFNKSHLTELIKCFLEEKHICQVQLDG